MTIIIKSKDQPSPMAEPPKSVVDTKTINQIIAQQTLLNVGETANLFGVSRPTFAKKICKNEGFPKPIILPGSKAAWRLGDLLAYQEQFRVTA
jgi:predicted DNA-binding transcriptional regulator AlpA